MLNDSSAATWENKKILEELERIRSQFYIFYELTKAMRSTLRLEEIVYIILTGLTAHQGLAFNRAIIFLLDEDGKTIKGYMGIGSMDNQDAAAIWHNIEDEKKDLYDLIRAFHQIKNEKKPKFMEFIQSLSFSNNKDSGLIFDALTELGTLHINGDKTKKFLNDPLVKNLQLDDFLISSLWIKNKPSGILIVDNNITKKLISEEDIRIFNMFVDQAEGAIENSQAFEDTLEQAHTDPLTGLWNHGYFQYKLDEEFMRTKSKNNNISLMMLDLDDFKKFNDSRGHVDGDKALKAISAILRENVRKVEILSRYGGEEFAIIIPATKKEDAFYLGERIRKAIEETAVCGYNFTISIGIASFPQDCETPENLVQIADQALFRAKHQGKNRVILA